MSFPKPRLPPVIRAIFEVCVDCIYLIFTTQISPGLRSYTFTIHGSTYTFHRCKVCQYKCATLRKRRKSKCGTPFIYTCSICKHASAHRWQTSAQVMQCSMCACLVHSCAQASHTSAH